MASKVSWLLGSMDPRFWESSYFNRRTFREVEVFLTYDLLCIITIDLLNPFVRWKYYRSFINIPPPQRCILSIRQFYLCHTISYHLLQFINWRLVTSTIIFIVISRSVSHDFLQLSWIYFEWFDWLILSLLPPWNNGRPPPWWRHPVGFVSGQYSAKEKRKLQTFQKWKSSQKTF